MIFERRPIPLFSELIPQLAEGWLIYPDPWVQIAELHQDWTPGMDAYVKFTSQGTTNLQTMYGGCCPFPPRGTESNARGHDLRFGNPRTISSPFDSPGKFGGKSKLVIRIASNRIDINPIHEQIATQFIDHSFQWSIVRKLKFLY